MIKPITENLFSVEKLIIEGKIKQALQLLEQLSTQYPENITIQVLSARCYLALNNTAQAHKIYTSLAAGKTPDSDEARPEALLALGKYKEALKHYEAYFKQKRTGRMLFTAALAAYKCGSIIKSQVLLKQAVKRDYEWEDNSSLDILARYILPAEEYTDLEQLYLDADEQVENQTNGHNNRWMSINIPIYEFLRNPAGQKQNASILLDLLDSREFEPFLDNGKTELANMLNEITDIHTDARFGLETQKLLQENKFPELSALLLALLLEQTSRDGQLFDLQQEFIKSSQLQDLIVVLPLKIAIPLLFLFSIANPMEQNQDGRQKLDENLVAGLLALCIITYNREIKKLQGKDSPQKQ